MPEAISRREAARRHGVNESTVRKAIASGGLAKAILPNGKLDAAKVADLLPKLVTRGPVLPVALVTARTRRLRIQVETLRDEVEAMKLATIPPEDAAATWASTRDGLVAHIVAIPGRVEACAGLPAREAHEQLLGIINALLDEASAPDEPAWWDEAPNGDAWWDEPLSDVMRMTPTMLLAARINLQAERDEIERALTVGRLRSVADFADAVSAQMSVAKSLVLALPGRVASQAEHATGEQLRSLVAFEVQHVIAELAPTP
ncbi:MAG: hypothetical protein ABL879_14090 [Devosia sp.]